MSDRLAGKVALISGAGDGIGRATALRFAGEGAQLVLCDIRMDKAQAVAGQIGASALPIECDVTDEKSVDKTVSAGMGKFGRIDALLNFAGGGSTRDGAVTELDLDEFWRAIRVDLYGTLLCCRRVIPEMIRSGAGSIVNMSSLRAVIGTAGADAYSASKGGVLSMSRAMAMQWADKNIRVNVLAPGVVLSDRVAAMIQPENPIYQKSLLGPSEPADVADLALYLASDESRKMTGAVLRLDGGASAH
ncbi:MAG: SDR family NAD(P)-dependent oxidoreductase [Pseudomonadota bacterium]